MTLPRLRDIMCYGSIGAFCAALHVCIMIGGDGLGFHFAVLVTVSYVACVIAGYLLHCAFTFQIAPRMAEFARYAAAMALNYPLTLAIVWLLHDRLGLAMLIAAPASTIILTAYNFVSSRWAVASSVARQIERGTGQ